MEAINLEKKKWLAALKALKFITILAILTASVITIKDEIIWQSGLSDQPVNTLGNDESTNEGSQNDCNVAGIKLFGVLLTYMD